LGLPENAKEPDTRFPPAHLSRSAYYRASDESKERLFL
jgi:hypothetical protein